MKNKNTLSLIVILVLLLIFLALGLIMAKNIGVEISLDFIPDGEPSTEQPFDWNDIKNSLNESRGKIIKGFSGEDEFKKYLLDYSESGYGYGAVRTSIGFDVVEEVAPIAMMDGDDSAGSLAQNKAERVSGTNVQVLSIDEPDIVKTDGENIFYSDYFFGRYYLGDDFIGIEPVVDFDFGGVSKMIAPEYSRDGLTKIIFAFPPEELSLLGEIEKGGDLFIAGDVLVVLGNEKISGFDISDPENVQSTWEKSLEDRHYIVSSRMYNNQVYLITAKYINHERPCDITPLTGITVKCSDIYHPIDPTAVDLTYTILALDPSNGEIKDQTSFVGSAGYTNVYMSEKNLYATYTSYPKTFPVIVDFFTKELNNIIPENIIAKIKKLDSYDISEQAKMTELTTILDSYRIGLDSDELLQIENDIQNVGVDYFGEHMRELSQSTGIIKIALNNLNVTGSVEVPGTTLNQFSMDENDGYLRVATTIEGYVPWFGFNFRSGEIESVSEIWVLGTNLSAVGHVGDLGTTERIYSVRFLGDTGYVVTFREVDPFYVIDLSNPSNPTVKGQLKIPGYSSYLHPIDDNHILGIGRDSSNVKVSLFDVSNPANPVEVSKYILKEYWSELLNNHHAFLMDTKHKVFFLPGSNGAYVMSYSDNEIDLKKAISEFNPRRALYLDDYMYILSQEKVIVLDENTWERVEELDL